MTHGSRALLLLLLALGRPSLAEPAPPPEAPQFRVERLRAPGRLLAVRAVDLDHDGHRDLLAVWLAGTAAEPRRTVGVFFDRKGAYRAAPDQVLAVPASASFLTVADVEGDARAELLLGDTAGLSALTLGERGYGEPHRLVEVPGIALPPDAEALPLLDLVGDFDGDGKTELLLPQVDRLAVVARGASGWARTGELLLPPRPDYTVRTDGFEPHVRNFTLRIDLTVPELARGEWDGDGRPDLFAIVDDIVTVFRGRPAEAGGFFDPAPVARVVLGVRTPAETARHNAVIQITLLDVDGDGISDLAVNKVAGGIAQMRAQLGIYRGKKGGGFGKPAQLIVRSGFAGSASFADLDGDGRPELVLPYTAVGFSEAMRFLLSRRLAIGFEVHRNLGPRGFDERAAATRTVDFPLDYSGGASLDAPFPTLDGDFNGDGVPDFAAPLKDGFAVHLGGGKELVAEYPRAIVHVRPTRFWRVLDLDGDRRADIVFFQRFAAEREGEIVVLRNTGRGW